MVLGNPTEGMHLPGAATRGPELSVCMRVRALGPTAAWRLDLPPAFAHSGAADLIQGHMWASTDPGP